MEYSISLKEYISMIKRRKILIASMIIFITVLAYIISAYFIAPVYEANTTLIVNGFYNQETIKVTDEDISVKQQLAITYAQIIKSRSVVNKVIEKLNLDMNYEDLIENIDSESVDGTEIINIKVRAKDKVLVKDITNTIASVFINEVKRIMNANSIEVIDEAIEPIEKVKPSILVNTLLAFLFSIVFSFFIVIIFEYLSLKLKSANDIENCLNMPILGVINYDAKIKKEDA